MSKQSQRHKANSHGASVGNGGLADQMAARRRTDGTEAGGKAIVGTSIFDPVLTELLIRWFCPEGGAVLDPYAGGSVRGIVSAMLGRRYHGIDLSERQIIANRAQGEEILAENETEGAAVWQVGESLAACREMAAGESRFDFVMTCPPYADLEIYSKEPDDISNWPYARFRKHLASTIEMAALMLADNRFLAIVIGDARDRKTGNLYGLPAHLVTDMIDAGLHLHNRAILATPAGSAPTRARNGFTKNRRLCSTHQEVIVFVKGSAALATEACGPCDFGAFDPLEFQEGTGPVLSGADAIKAAIGA